MAQNYGIISGDNPIEDPRADGPLADLYGRRYTFNNLFYPRNLDTDQRAHCIVFYINVAKRSSFLDGSSYSGIPDTLSVLESGGRAYENYNSSLLADDKDYTLARKTRRITSAIALYMPDNVTVAYNNNWQDTSFTSAFGKAGAVTQGIDALYEGAKNALSSGNKGIMNLISSYVAEKGTQAAGFDFARARANEIFGPEAGDFVMFMGGYAINPQLEVLYKGVGLRSFQFDFVFSPFNRDEVKNVKSIIETFKFHAAPEVLEAAGAGRYMVPPSEFDIDFLYRGKKNPNIHQVGTCVLTGINVDYSPNGWSTFGGEDFERGAGAPVQAKLSLSFQEVEIVTKNKVKSQGY